MRIISGMRKGLKLKSPTDLRTRPTTDRVKESLFNLLQFHLPCDEVLDLFAGSGALGIEALSRHCGHAVLVEKDPQTFRLVQENLQHAGFSDRASLHHTDAMSYLAVCNTRFDLIFLDPPYNRGYLQPVLEQIAARDLLKPDGILVLETEKGGEMPEHPIYTTRRVASYGKTTITLLQR